jgi:hypothetical protein
MPSGEASRFALSLVMGSSVTLGMSSLWILVAAVVQGCGGESHGDGATAGAGSAAVVESTTADVDQSQGGRDSGSAGTSSSAGASSSGCEYEGVTYPLGSSFIKDDGCSTSCYCDVGGLSCSTAMSCGVSCLVGDGNHPSGSTFSAGDGCNTCTCRNASYSCSSIPCVATECTYGGVVHQTGETFRSNDGCSTECTCTAGVVTCDAQSCDCNVSTWRHRLYVSLDVSECATLDLSCPKNSTPVFDSCGCGCEQSQTCPEVFDCSTTPDGSDVSAGGSEGQDCPTSEQVATCPLTEVPE